MNNHKYDKIDLTGYRHGRLTVISKSDHGRTLYVCRCDCGKEKEMTAYYIFHDLSCGCMEKENKDNLGEHNITHGMTETRLYRTWCKMKERCYNPNIQYYPRYGGRGITICDEWRYSFESFHDWAFSVGYDSSLTGNEQSLDRINPDGNYEPSNCRWITHKEQCRNRTNNRFVVHHGKKMTVSEFCETYGITYHKYVTRNLEKGLTTDDVISKWNKKHNKCA